MFLPCSRRVFRFLNTKIETGNNVLRKEKIGKHFENAGTLTMFLETRFLLPGPTFLTVLSLRRCGAVLGLTVLQNFNIIFGMYTSLNINEVWARLNVS